MKSFLIKAVALTIVFALVNVGLNFIESISPSILFLWFGLGFLFISSIVVFFLFSKAVEAKSNASYMIRFGAGLLANFILPLAFILIANYGFEMKDTMIVIIFFGMYGSYMLLELYEVVQHAKKVKEANSEA